MNRTIEEIEKSTARPLPGSIIRRLFVFNSFDEGISLDLQSNDAKSLGTELVVFPPSQPVMSEDDDKPQFTMLELHLTVIVNDIAVSIFRQHESRIKRNDAEVTSSSSTAASLVKAVSAIADKRRRSIRSNPLLTPIDEQEWSKSQNTKDSESKRKKQVARREKLSADLALLAGSPLDAYKRYVKAAELTKATFDPIWNAAAMEGIAASLVAMADVGGAGVDEFLASEYNSSGPDDTHEGRKKAGLAATILDDVKDLITQAPPPATLPAAVYTHAMDALNIYAKNVRLSSLYSELALKLAKYMAKSEDSHVFCRWGEGEHCFSGDTVTGFRRLERSDTVASFGSTGSMSGEGSSYFEQYVPSPLVPMPTQVVARCSRISELLHRATAAEGLSSESRMRVCVIAAKACLGGVSYSLLDHVDGRLKYCTLGMRRKAAFFSSMAADCDAQIAHGGHHGNQLWRAAAALYTHSTETNSYGWANLRLAVLHGLSQCNSQLSGESASTEASLLALLSLLSEISPAAAEETKSKVASSKSMGSIEELSDGVLSSDSSPERPDRKGRAQDRRDSYVKSSSLGFPPSPPLQAQRHFSAPGDLQDDLDASDDDDDGGGAETDLNSSTSLTPTRPVSVKGAMDMLKNKTKSTMSTMSHFTKESMDKLTPSFSLGMLDDGSTPTKKPHDDTRRPSLSNVHALACSMQNFTQSRSSLSTFDAGSMMSSAANKANRSSSIGTVDERIKAELAAATARAIIGMDSDQGGEAGSGGGGTASNLTTSTIEPLYSFPCVIADTEVRAARAATRDVVIEIFKLREGGGEGSGSRNCGFSGSDLFNPARVTSVSEVELAGRALTVEKKKVARSKNDPLLDNMETFFNPFEERRKEEARVKESLICEGDEFSVDVTFESKLIVPLEVSNCALVFGGREGEEEEHDGAGRVRGATSVILPSKNATSKVTTVRFSVVGGAGGNTMHCNGIEFTCLNRAYRINFGGEDGGSSESSTENTIPAPNSSYPRSVIPKKKVRKAVQPLVLRSVPPQPCLVVAGHRSDKNGNVLVGVKDCCAGEVRDLPAFKLDSVSGVAVEDLVVVVANDGFRNKSGVGVTIVVAEDKASFTVSLAIDGTAKPGVASRVLSVKYRGSAASLSNAKEAYTELYWRTIDVALDIEVVQGPRIVRLRFASDPDYALIAPELAKQRKILARGKGEDLKGSGDLRRALSRSEPEILGAWAQDTLSDSEDDDRSVGGRSGVNTPVNMGLTESGSKNAGAVQMAAFQLEGMGFHGDEFAFESCGDRVQLVMDVENSLSTGVVVAGDGGDSHFVGKNGVVRVTIGLDRVTVGAGNVLDYLTKSAVVSWKSGARGGQMQLDRSVLEDMIDVEGKGWVEKIVKGTIKVAMGVGARAEQKRSKRVKVGEFIDAWCVVDKGGGKGARTEFVCARADSGGGSEGVAVVGEGENNSSDVVLWNGKLARSILEDTAEDEGEQKEHEHGVQLCVVEEGTFYVWGVLVRENRAWATERVTLIVTK
jgi:hypothetical protein